MTDFSLWFLVISIVLISFTLLMFGMSVIPWCIRDTVDPICYSTSWSRMAIPAQDNFTVSIPPLPPYFFESEFNYKSFSESV